MLQCYNATIATMLQCYNCYNWYNVGSSVCRPAICLLLALNAQQLPDQEPPQQQPNLTIPPQRYAPFLLCHQPLVTFEPYHERLYFWIRYISQTRTFHFLRPSQTIMDPIWLFSHTLTFSHLHTFKFSDSHAFTLSDFHSFTLSDSQIKTTEFPVTHIVEGFRHYHFCSYFVKILMQLFCQNFNAVILSLQDIYIS